MKMPIYIPTQIVSRPQACYNVLDFGAVANGQVNNTEAIRQAIAECARHGGGTVYFPPGVYLTGSLHLCSNLAVHVVAGATVRFSQDFEDYPPVPTRWEGVECYGFTPLIYGKDLENVSLIGRGTLDGQGQAWWNELKIRRQEGRTRPETEIEQQLAQLNVGYESAGSGGGGREMQFLRPPLVQLLNCRNVLLQGLTHQNSPFWNTHLVYCENVVIDSMTFKNPSNAPNTDGLDIDSCRNVRIANCYFDVGDDCLCLKSGIDEDGRRVGKPTENVTITNCTMLRGHGGVVIGSEIAGSVRNVTISNCIFLGTDRGIRLKARRGRGGIVEDIQVSNIVMKEVLCPIVMNLFYRCGASPEDMAFSHAPRPVTEKTPVFRSIALTNIVAKGVRAAAGFFYGLPESPIQNVSLHDLWVETIQNPEESGSEPAMVYGLPPMTGRGIWGKYLQGCHFSHLNLTIQQGEGIMLEESQDIEIHALSLKNLPSDTPGIVLNQVEQAYIHGCRYLACREDFVRLQGQDTHKSICFDEMTSGIIFGFEIPEKFQKGMLK